MIFCGFCQFFHQFWVMLFQPFVKLPPVIIFVESFQVCLPCLVIEVSQHVYHPFWQIYFFIIKPVAFHFNSDFQFDVFLIFLFFVVFIILGRFLIEILDILNKITKEPLFLDVSLLAEKFRCILPLVLVVGMSRPGCRHEPWDNPHSYTWAGDQENFG